MAKSRRWYPITSRMVTQSKLDVFDRLAENKSDSGGTNPRIRRSVLTESVTVVEQIMRLAMEEHLESEGVTERVVEPIADIGRDASVSKARVEAGFKTYQNVEAVRRGAVECGLGAVLRWLDEEGGAEAIDGLMEDRHDLIHSLGFSTPDDVGACRTAEGLMRSASDGSPRDRAVAKLVEGSWMDMAGRADDARAAYEEALEECRGHLTGSSAEEWAYICAGHALAHLGLDGEAEEIIGRALRAYPRSAVAHLEMGNLMMSAGKYQEAFAAYSKSIECDPAYAPARIYRGHAIQMREGPDHVLVVEDYSHGLALDPDAVSAYVGRGMSLAERGMHGEAAEEFERAVEVDPDDAASYVALGHARAAAGRDAKAADAYRKAIETAGRVGFRAAGGGKGRPGAPYSASSAMEPRLRYRLGGGSAYTGMAGVLFRGAARTSR